MIQRDYLILGAGVGGAAVCEALRSYDQKGSVTLVGNESSLPYRRPKLWNAVLTPQTLALEQIQHLTPEWYGDNGVELRLETLVNQINLERRLAVLNTGQVIEFRKACLAMGSRPRRPQVAGAHLGNVIFIRNVRDFLATREIAANEKSIVIVGGGFIAAECAAALRCMGLAPKIMCRHPHLWQKWLDPDTARWLTEEFEKQGVPLVHETLNGFEGKTVLRSIQTKSGNRIPTGLAIVAVGAEPNLGLVTNTPLASLNGAPVNEYMETDEKGIFAVGDIALYPDAVFGGVRRSEHFESTLAQARIAGGNITGKKRQKYKALPYHTSAVFDLRFEFVGDFRQTPSQVKIEGDRAKRQFTARYFQGSKLMGVLLCNQSEEKSSAAQEETLNAHQKKPAA